jgi:hypothetical protein
MTTTEPEPYARLEWITPQQAKELVAPDRNRVNRTKRWPRIREYAADIVAKQWKVTGETIGLDVDGCLVQGQHRLLACIEADKPFRTFVVYDLARDAQQVMDSGMKRSVSDALHMRGEQNATPLAALVRLTIAYEADHELRERTTKTSNTFVLRRFDEDPELFREAVKAGQSAYQQSGKMASPATWALAWVLFASIDRDDASDFFELVKTGDGVRKGDPVYALRRFLTDRIINSSGARRIAMAVIVKAWNAYRDGTRIDLLMFRAGGVAAEKMPEPK